MKADELPRGWKKCSCPIYASGTLSGRFKRKNAERTDWSDAKAIAVEWQSAGSWDGSRKSPEPIPVAAAEPFDKETPLRIMIRDAISAYLAVREGAKIAPATVRKYKTFTKQLAAFAEARGYLMLDQFTSADIDVFYSGWKLEVRVRRGSAYYYWVTK